MMNFFEFFFSEPNWGWRLLGLVWLVSIIGSIILKLVTAYLNYRVSKFKEEIAAGVKVIDNVTTRNTNTTMPSSDKLTKDDFR